MSAVLTKLQKRMQRLHKIHLRAIGAFHAYETLQEFRATNILGKKTAQLNAQAIGVYRGFFNPAQQSMETEIHISLAKLFDSHKDALHIEKLVRYAEANQSKITKSQQAALDKSPEVRAELAKVYEGLSRDDLKEIKTDFARTRDKIARLKEIRDKRVAHEDLSNSPPLKYLTYEELAELLKIAEKIMNLVSSRIYGNATEFKFYKKQVVVGSRSLFNLIAKSEGIVNDPKKGS